MNILRKLTSNNLSLTFIGMPGSGKSYISKYISELYKIKLIEVDENIEKTNKANLFELIEKFGDETFKQLEENEIKKINFTKQNIISTGGSVIYSKKSMNYLNSLNNLIIYLDTDFELLKERTENFTNRGIVFNKTPYELYLERDILYRRYCDFSIKTDNKTLGKLIYDIGYFL